MTIEEYIAVSNRSELIGLVSGAVLFGIILLAGGKIGKAVERATGMKIVAVTLFLVVAFTGYIACLFFYDWLYHLQMGQFHDPGEFYCHIPSSLADLGAILGSVAGLIIFLRSGSGAALEN